MVIQYLELRCEMIEFEFNQTQLKILERLKADFEAKNPDNISTTEGTFAFDTMSASAVEFEKGYAEDELILAAAFLETSWGPYLEMIGNRHNIHRKKATKAIVELTVFGNSGAQLLKGSMFATATGVNFITSEDVIIPASGQVNVKAEAQEPGAGFNVEADTINKIPVSIYGISKVNNPEAAYDGFDEEEDEELRKRIDFKVNMPATSNNDAHYKLMAQEVPGVGEVWVIPLWAGNGTVKVVIGDSNNDFPSDDLISKVANHIAEFRIIGPTVTVVGPTKVAINIQLKVTDGTGTAEEIKNMVNDYFRSKIFNLPYVSVAKIGQMILEKTGINDYANLTVNGGVDNITINEESMPYVKDVKLIV